jgi:hypothetical protein
MVTLKLANDQFALRRLYVGLRSHTHPAIRFWDGLVFTCSYGYNIYYPWYTWWKTKCLKYTESIITGWQGRPFGKIPDSQHLIIDAHYKSAAQTYCLYISASIRSTHFYTFAVMLLFPRRAERSW